MTQIIQVIIISVIVLMLGIGIRRNTHRIDDRFGRTIINIIAYGAILLGLFAIINTIYHHCI